MTSATENTDSADTTEFHLVPRNLDGTPSDFGAGLISGVVGELDYTISSGPTLVATSEEAKIIDELAKTIASPGVVMPNLTPFLVLKKTNESPAARLLSKCQCQCGGNWSSCGGGGGGH